jgi:tetratricopeptide (TPR) repeat protein
VGDIGGTMATILNFEKDFSNDSDKAQNLVWDAWDAETKTKAKTLALKALVIDPECCDAFNVLAWTTSDPVKEKEYYKKAIDVFKKRYTDEYFEETKGYFWGMLETRPFMRALQGYGRNLYDDGQKEEAIETYSYMLDLNPNDNQGVRFVLLSWLIIAGQFQKARKLLSQYDSCIANMIYDTLLLDIVEKKSDAQIKKSYASAIDSNSHIVAFLLGEKKLPKTIPTGFSLGSVDEAVVYLTDEFGQELWHTYPDALKTLASLGAKI